MQIKKTIVFLLHENDQPFPQTQYLLKHLANEWYAQGMRIMLAYGTQHFIPGDAVFSHIDVSVIDKSYQDYMQQYSVAINQQVINIQSRHFSQQLVTENSNYIGPVIVKTNNNYGGLPERGMQERRLGKEIPKPDFVDWATLNFIAPEHYPIFPSIQHVPKGVWQNPELIAEKFLPEMDNEGYFVMNAYLFFGSREIGIRVTSKNPVIKGENIIKRELNNNIPEQVRQRRKELGFDYGRLDYTIVNNEIVLFDTNKTPSLSEQGASLYYQEIVKNLSLGIHDFM